jgi:hypothetical protein
MFGPKKEKDFEDLQLEFIKEQLAINENQVKFMKDVRETMVDMVNMIDALDKRVKELEKKLQL